MFKNYFRFPVRCTRGIQSFSYVFIMFRSASLRLDGIFRGFEAWCRECTVLNSKSCIHHHRPKPLWLHWSLIQGYPRIWNEALLFLAGITVTSFPTISSRLLCPEEIPTERHSVTFGRFSDSGHFDWKCRVFNVIWIHLMYPIPDSATAVCSLISTSWKDHTAWVHMAPSPAKSIGSKWEDWQKEQKGNEKERTRELKSSLNLPWILLQRVLWWYVAALLTPRLKRASDAATRLKRAN